MEDELLEECQIHKSILDLSWVPNHCLAVQTGLLWEHQLRKQGIKCWTDYIENMKKRNVSEMNTAWAPPVQTPPSATHMELWHAQCQQIAMLEAHTRCRHGSPYMHVSIWLACTDAGPDQARLSRDVANDLSEHKSAWVTWTCCLIHQLHLMIKRQLARATSTFFSDLAKMCNVWRAPHNAVAIYDAWRDLYSPARAKQVAHKLPPKLLRGRFGSLDRVSQFFLNATMVETATVYRHVFVAAAHEKLPDPEKFRQDEDEEDYRAKLTRWKRDAVAAAGSFSHWRKTIMLHAARRPAMRLMYWFEKQATNAKARR